MCMTAKTRININVDGYIVEKAKKRGINISAMTEEELRKRLQIFDKNLNPETCKHEYSNWFCVPAGLAKQCLRCGKIEVNKYFAEKCKKFMNDKPDEKTLNIIKKWKERNKK